MSPQRPPLDDHDNDGLPPDYLWDAQGPADADVQALERALAPLAWRAPSRRAPMAAPSTTRPDRNRWQRRRIGAALGALAASVLLTVGLWGGLHHRLQWPHSQAWPLSQRVGQVSIDGVPLSKDAALAPGQWLETGDGHVRMSAARIGQVVIGEHSRFRIERTGSGRHRAQLQQGSLWARVWAPPGQFGVGTPMGEVIDLGCEFLLRAAPDGSGSLSVSSGWVQLDNGWHEVLVPQGARVDIAAGGRIGTPYDLRSSQPFRAALRQVDAETDRLANNDPRLRELLAQARAHDAYSLLQLLQRRPEMLDSPLFDRLTALMPEGAPTREQVRSEGRRALNGWWKQLPYPRTKQWWLHWPDAVGSGADGEQVLQGN